jgi:putative ABC transport system permease protein
MRPGAIEGIRRRRLAPRGAWAAAALAGAALLSRAGPVDGFPLFGFAAVGLVVAALALSSPLLVRATAVAARGPLRGLFGVAGRLASRFFGGSLARNGIAVAALAMALGMTLAMIVTVASIRETVRLWVESTLRADLWIKSDSGGRPGIVSDLPEEIISLLGSLPGVVAVDPFRATSAVDAAGRPFTLASGDFRVVARMGGLPLLDGRDPRTAAARAREEGAVLVSEPYARRFGLGRGDSVTLRTPQGTRAFRIEAVYRDFSNDRGTVVLDRQLAVSLFGDRRVTSLALAAAPGVSSEELRRRVLERSRGRFALSVTTNRELRREVLAVFDQTFAVTRALEAIAVAVAILGIANASIASVIERRRSFALLRAVGASKAQIRGAVLLEAVLAGLAATVAAAASGAAFAAILLLVINPQSFGWTVALRLPWGDLALVTVLVLVAAVAAAVFPSRLAAAVDPTAALAEE